MRPVLPGRGGAAIEDDAGRDHRPRCETRQYSPLSFGAADPEKYFLQENSFIFLPKIDSALLALPPGYGAGFKTSLPVSKSINA